MDYIVLSCDACNCDIEEAWPRYVVYGSHFCGECAFKNNLISEREYLKNFLFMSAHTDDHVGINPKGEIEVWSGSKVPPWERVYRDRNNPRNRVWRKAVFERDNYTCQRCQKRGGELQAHHIKPYAKYEKLRYEISNGVCLCESCHKLEHKKGV